MPTGLLAIILGAALAATLLSACGDSGSDEGAAQYRDRTDSPLLEFGVEGSEAEFEQASAAVRGFFVGRANGDFARACAPLAKSILDRLKQLATNSTSLRDTSCPSFLETFIALTPAERRESVVVDAGSLRHQGSQGYLFYAGFDDVVYATPMNKEDGEWKLATLSSKQLSESEAE